MAGFSCLARQGRARRCVVVPAFQLSRDPARDGVALFASSSTSFSVAALESFVVSRSTGVRALSSTGFGALVTVTLTTGEPPAVDVEPLTACRVGATVGANAPSCNTNDPVPSDGFESGGSDTTDAENSSVPNCTTVTFRITRCVNPTGKKSSGHVTLCPDAVHPDPRSTCVETRLHSCAGNDTVKVASVRPLNPTVHHRHDIRKRRPNTRRRPRRPQRQMHIRRSTSTTTTTTATTAAATTAAARRRGRRHGCRSSRRGPSTRVLLDAAVTGERVGGPVRQAG